MQYGLIFLFTASENVSEIVAEQYQKLFTGCLALCGLIVLFQLFLAKHAYFPADSLFGGHFQFLGGVVLAHVLLFLTLKKRGSKVKILTFA